MWALLMWDKPWTVPSCCFKYLSLGALLVKDQLQQKIVCPGVVTCLTASPDGLYVLAGIAEAIYLWEVSTGNLLVVLNRHYQDLSCLRFTDDCSHFVSGGKDNLALVWNLASHTLTRFSENSERILLAFLMSVSFPVK
ncbi:WD repeat-containing protein 18 isoform X1 [Tachysurus ichikawai]